MGLARRAFVGVAFLVAGCRAPQQAKSPSAPARPATCALSDVEIDRMTSRLSAIRRLPSRRAVPVQCLDRVSFVEEHARARRGDERPAPRVELDPETAFLVGFDFLPEPSKRAGIAALDQLQATHVVGFYDQLRKGIVISEREEHTPLDQLYILAHELEHALQAQHFAELRATTGSDEALAQSALIEGDAQVASGAFLAAETGVPVRRMLRLLAETPVRAQPTTTERTRTRLMFPYEEGRSFVTDVYRAGGFPLVDRMFTSPPRSTAQILHPEKYLSGHQPRPIADPWLTGYQSVKVGTLGELDARIVLERCLDREVAARATAGWAGDRYGVFLGPERGLSVAWVSAWDTEDDAAQMEDALGLSAACWHPNAVGPEPHDYGIGDQVEVRRRGKMVAFLRSFPPGDTEPLAARLFGLVGPDLPPTAFAHVAIPPRVALTPPAAGEVRGGVYHDRWLGIVARVPEGMTATLNDGSLVIRHSSTFANGSVAISTPIPSREQNDKTFEEYRAAFAAEADKLNLPLIAHEPRTITTTLGNAFERSWETMGWPAQLRVVLVPICAGTGAIVLARAHRDPEAGRILDAWMTSIQWTGKNPPAACNYLNPK